MYIVFVGGSRWRAETFQSLEDPGIRASCAGKTYCTMWFVWTEVASITCAASASSSTREGMIFGSVPRARLLARYGTGIIPSGRNAGCARAPDTSAARRPPAGPAAAVPSRLQLARPATVLRGIHGTPWHSRYPVAALKRKRPPISEGVSLCVRARSGSGRPPWRTASGRRCCLRRQRHPLRWPSSGARSRRAKSIRRCRRRSPC